MNGLNLLYITGIFGIFAQLMAYPLKIINEVRSGKRRQPATYFDFKQ